MATSEKSVLEFVTRLTYNLEGVDRSLKLYLSQFLTFHFSKTLSANVIQHAENKRALEKYKNDTELGKASAGLSLVDRAWCVAVIRLLKKKAEDDGDRVLSIRLNGTINQLISRIGLESEQHLIDEQFGRIEREISEFQNRKVIKIPTSIWPLVLDFSIRVLLLFTFGLTGSDLNLLPAFNATPIPAVILVISYIASRRDRRHNTKLLEDHGGVHRFHVQFVMTARQYTWLAFFLGVGVFIAYLLPDQLYTLAFIGLTVYYIISLRFFRVGRIEENELVRQIEQTSHRAKDYDFDRNDEEIVRIETSLNSFTSRLDAYVLESALFGALTFSGFLQIMASDLVSFADLENFSRYIFESARAFIYLDSAGFYTGLTNLGNKVSLLSLVSVESLICSGFFLAVIASRLRFSDIADRVTSSLNIAKTYNSKEEALIAEHETTERRPGRLAELNAKVSEQINIASDALEKVNPVMMYMRYFRNAGILVFIVILISSTLFITSALGWTFIAMVAATYVYFNFGKVTLWTKAAYLELRMRFVRRAGLNLLFAASPMIVSPFFSGTRYWLFGDFLVAVGYISLALYVFLWLLLAAHVDENFGDIEAVDAKDVSRSSRWEFVKNIFAVVILILGAGLALKELHLKGADEVILITSTILMILSYFFAYYLSKVRWLGIISGILLAICCNGILFKILHLNGANEMLYVGLAGLVVQLPLMLIMRKTFHRLFLRLVATMVVIILMFGSNVLFKLQVITSHRTFNIAPIVDVLATNRSNMLLNDLSTIDDAMKKADWYRQTYQMKLGYSVIYQGLVRNYGDLIRYVREGKEFYGKVDSTMIGAAIRAARERERIITMFNYDPEYFDPYDSMEESELLLMLGQKEQAIKSLEGLLSQNRSPEFNKTVAGRIEAAKSGI